MIHGELQQAEAAALAGQPLVQQRLEVTAALEPGEGIGVVTIVQLGHGRVQMAHHPQQLAPFVTAHPFFQPDVVTLMVQDAVLEPQPAAAPLPTGIDGLPQAGPVIRVHPGQPAEIIQLVPRQPQQLQAGGIAPQALFGRPGPDPGLQHRHGFCLQRHLKRGNDLNPGSLIPFHHAPRHRI
ncbi:hypothetical protein D3C75_951530 [compost metagenome]